MIFICEANSSTGRSGLRLKAEECVSCLKPRLCDVMNQSFDRSHIPQFEPTVGI